MTGNKKINDHIINGSHDNNDITTITNDDENKTDNGNGNTCDVYGNMIIFEIRDNFIMERYRLHAALHYNNNCLWYRLTFLTDSAIRCSNRQY